MQTLFVGNNNYQWYIITMHAVRRRRILARGLCATLLTWIGHDSRYLKFELVPMNHKGAGGGWWRLGVSGIMDAVCWTEQLGHHFSYFSYIYNTHMRYMFFSYLHLNIFILLFFATRKSRSIIFTVITSGNILKVTNFFSPLSPLEARYAFNSNKLKSLCLISVLSLV